MGARALGVGAFFVNVLLILAQGGSRSKLPPRPPPPHSRLPLLPSCVSSGKAGSADTQLPRHQLRCAFRGAELPAAFCVFFLKGGSGSTHFDRVWHAIVPVPALREHWMRRKSSSSTLALSLELGVRGAKQGPPGTGEEFVRVLRGR